MDLYTIMTNEEIENIAKETCKTLGRFFALYSFSINDDDFKNRIKKGNLKAYRFRKGLYDLSTLEFEKLMQLKTDYDRKELLK